MPFQHFAQNQCRTLSGYLTPEETEIPSSLASSSLETPISKTRRSDTHPGPCSDNTKPPRPKAKPKSAKRSNGHNNTGDAGLRFFVVGHPDELKDKSQMRKNRMHVMHNYLDKESQKPDSKDSRVRRKSGRDPTTSGDSSAALSHFHRDDSRLTPPDSIRSSGSSQDFSDRIEVVSRTDKAPKLAMPKAHSVPEGSSAANCNNQSLVAGLGGRYDNSHYMLAKPDDVPFLPTPRSILPVNSIDGVLEPFEVWPQFTDPRINIGELKWSCAQRFGSSGLKLNWVPIMLKARHAFLSTLCISSSYDDLMKRSFLPAHQRNNDTLISRIRVRQSVIAMINECLNDAEMRIADSTIVAVLHVLFSEIMACDDRSMVVHQHGLREMVRERGGLDRLGAGGQLAFVLTILDYLIGALRETLPHRTFIDFAASQTTKIPSYDTKLPESPVYCRPQGFYTISNILPRGSGTYELLNTLRALTNRFYTENVGHTTDVSSPSRAARFSERSDDTISGLCGKIFAIPPAWEQDFSDMNERYTFESIRLVGLIYAHALSKKTPFSVAAVELRRRNVAYLPEGSASMPTLIKSALMRTNTSACWDHLVGVLFWVALIAGAAAHSGPIVNEEREGDAEDTRKWITAISVRSCILLSFEYSSAILETLKRVVAIEEVLNGSVPARDKSQAIDAVSHFDEDNFSATGLSESPPLRRGIVDFAQQSLGIRSDWEGVV